MPINQQELAEAIETISEGGQALGVSYEDVIDSLASRPSFVFAVFDNIMRLDYGRERLAKVFDREAEAMLTEALRAKQEVENGLL